MKIYVDDLEELLDIEKKNSKARLVINILLASINDWPKAVDSLSDFDDAVNKFIRGSTSKMNISNSLKNIDFSKYSWESESLTGLLDVFEYYDDGLSLKEIIFHLESSYTKCSKKRKRS